MSVIPENPVLPKTSVYGDIDLFDYAAGKKDKKEKSLAINEAKLELYYLAVRKLSNMFRWPRPGKTCTALQCHTVWGKKDLNRCKNEM